MTGTVREYLYAGGEAPTAMRSRNSDGSYSNYFFVTNTHGDVVALTDRDGNVVNRYAYGPWGEATRVSEQVHQPFRFAGYRYEDGFDLYYLRARWMDPNTGRFLSRDPVPANPLHLTSFNRYAYAEGCPSTFTDPNGTDVRCTQGIYRLAQLLDIHADVYVGGRNNYDNVHDFVEAIARKFAGINDLAGIEAAVATGNQPQTAPTEIDSVGWNPDFVDEKYPGQHLIAFVAYGFYKHNLSGTLAASAQEIAAGSLGTLQDKLLGDVGYELGSGLYRGALGGYAGEDAYLRSVPSLNARDLGGEIIRRLGSGRCQTGFKGDYQKIPYPAI